MDPISIFDFAKVELRIGKILVAETIEGSDRLFRIEVDLGEEKPRQVLSGIRKWYSAENLIGRQVVVVANLEPREMMGLTSYGMLLAAVNENDDAVLLTASDIVPAGSKVR